MISTRARFAFHGLSYLATRPPGDPTSFALLFDFLRGWSGRLVLSRSYVSKVFQDLSRAGLVKAVPGRKGGYRLARPPREITLLEVVRLIDRNPASDCCLLSDGECPIQDHCGYVDVMEEAQLAFDRVLASQTIETMARKMPRVAGPELAGSPRPRH